MGEIKITSIDDQLAHMMVIDALENLSRAFIENPNYFNSLKDWNVHYECSKEIIRVYSQISHQVFEDSDELLEMIKFLSNVKAHIFKLEELKKLGMIINE